MPMAGGWMRGAALGVAVSGIASPAGAGSFEEALEARWRGAWVLTRVDLRSDCASAYTDNRLNGRLVTGSGGHRFGPGELAQVERVDLKRSRLDLKLALSEPVLVGRQEGPFTLYHDASCRVELEVELPRSVVSGKELAAVEEALRSVVQAYPAEVEARSAPDWNGRRVEP
jgi:hypothetical protein